MASLPHLKSICTELSKLLRNPHPLCQHQRDFLSMWAVLCIKHRWGCRHHLQSKNNTNRQASKHTRICGINTRSTSQGWHLLLLSTVPQGLAAWLSAAPGEEKLWRKKICMYYCRTLWCLHRLKLSLEQNYLLKWYCTFLFMPVF